MTSDILIVAARRMVPSLSRGVPVVYLARLKSGAIYIGCSLDLELRLSDHVKGNASRTTKIDPVVELLRVETCLDFSEARTREAQLKRWSRAKKEALARGDVAALKALSKSTK